MTRIALLIAALALAACANMAVPSNGGPIKVFLDKSANSGTHVTALLPLGNETLDSGGMDRIATLVARIPGVTRVYMYDYYQTGDAARAISSDPVSVKEAIIGFSCGANAAPVVAAGTGHRIDVLAVIQVSEWCGGTPLTGNVRRAQETYNPNCFDTGGLGCGRLVPGPNFNPSNLTFIERPDCHTCSDHDPDAQQDIVQAIEAVINANASGKLAARLGMVVPAAIRIITRYHGQKVY